MAPQAGSRTIGDFHEARVILRSSKLRQAGPGANQADLSKPDEISFFFLDGEAHRKRRTAVAGLFAPRTVVTRHRAVMDSTMDAIVADLRTRRRAPLDQLSWRMAVDVAANIIGLGGDGHDSEGLARRLADVLDSAAMRKPGLLGKLTFNVRMLLRAGRFYRRDMVPAIAARRRAPRDDVISLMVKENYSRKLMILECLSYGGAGMMTTREFIVMCAWHLFGNESLRDRFLKEGDDGQIAILEEILRLEPVATFVARRASENLEAGSSVVKQGEVVSINIREANSDQAITGPCPRELDPDRARRMKGVGSGMSFGDGPHRCPGAQVALHETRVFLDRMLRLPGIRLETEPTISWNAFIQGYELRGAIVACDPA